MPTDPFGETPYMFPPPFQTTSKTPFQAPYVPPQPAPVPWNPAAEIAASAASSDHRELVQAVRTAFPDPNSMPAHLKAILDKSEQHCQKLLGSDMRKCTTTLQKARKQLTELMEVKKSHQMAWIAHVKEATRVWSEQMGAYSTQQEDYATKITAVQQELKTAQQHIQDLGMQVLETQHVKEEQQDLGARLDLEQATAAQQLAAALAKCTQSAETAAMAPPVTPMEILASEEETDGDGPNKSRRTEERKRSLERPVKESAAPS